MEPNRKVCWLAVFSLLASAAGFGRALATGQSGETIQEKTIGLAVNGDGSYTVFDPASGKPILRAGVGAEVDHRWLKSGDYPKHSVSRGPLSGDLGPGTGFTIVHTGLAGQPDLVTSLELHGNPDFAVVSVSVKNTGSRPVAVQALRSVEAAGADAVDLGGPEASDRVLSDSFSEDRPGIVIHDLRDANEGMHRGVGSQLIYNRESKRNLFLGALSSDKFLTILRLHVNPDHIRSYEVDSAGTTELERENSLEHASPEDQIELSVPLAPGAAIPSERLLISTGGDYHPQLENYGRLIRTLHHARLSTPSFAGWWSWTAYYFGLSQDTALTNATWLAQNLKDLGYNFFHIDEGYQYARGEYTTPDAGLFPGGMLALESRVRALGLTPGIWTAPFEVSDRSWIYENHKDWLVHNAAGQPIHAGWVIGGKARRDPLYILDCTHPGAQDYLRKTYRTLTEDWGIRYIKLDFMDDSAIEGFYYKPHTTALEAQRIGLQIIRDAVGEEVLLDKDGSPMLNPVGLVDTGRISVDTGHTFEASREAAPGIAARYYMNRNFYVADPDAFTVSRQTVDEQEWHGGKRPLTLDEAKVSIALAAIAGGMYEIGDDLPSLGRDADRLALVKNPDLFSMSRLGHSSVPLDLMSYRPEDAMPSIFLLKESRRQAVLTVFNWTEKPTNHNLDLARDLGLEVRGHNQVLDVFGSEPARENVDQVTFQLTPRSVKVLKILDTSVQPAAPVVAVEAPRKGEAGEAVHFRAEADPAGVPVLQYHWEYGDGTGSEGPDVHHAYSRAGEFTARLRAEGLDGIPFEKTLSIGVTGKIDTVFVPSQKKRLTEAR